MENHTKGNAGRRSIEGGEPAGPAVTAVIVAEPAGGSLKIASLTVVDRLAVCLARAGASRLIVAGETRPQLARSRAMGLKVENVDQLPTLRGEVLVASGNVLATTSDLRRVIEHRGRLVTREGQRLPLGMVDGLAPDWRQRLDRSPEVGAGDLAALVAPDSASQVERAYWSSLTSSSDGWVDRHFNRPVGRLLSKKLVGGCVTPNQVSLLAIGIGLVSAWLFALGTAGTALAGALVLQLSAILDCVDGDLARALYKQSALGKWLDIVGDQVVHIGVFLGLGLGLWRSGSAAPVMVLGGIAAVGVVLSFLMVLRVLLKPSRRGHNRLQRLIDATTNRDFSVLLILFALFGVLEWFLWLAAVGSHAFWVVAAGLQLHETRKA